MGLLVERGSELQLNMVDWGPLYEAHLSLLGPNATLVPLGDSHHMNTAGTTVTTIGDQQVVFTATEALHLWDTPPTTQGIIPVINFNRIDEWLETLDAAFWNDSAGASEPSYYWSAWVNIVASAASNAIWAKGAGVGTGGSDWAFFISSTENFLSRIMDDSADAFIGSTAGILSGWHYLVATKHDDSANSASVITYVDGVEDRADSTSGTYVAQEDGIDVVRIGALRNDSAPNGNSIAGGPLGPIFIPVGTGQVPQLNTIKTLYEIGRRALSLV